MTEQQEWTDPFTYEGVGTNNKSMWLELLQVGLMLAVAVLITCALTCLLIEVVGVVGTCDSGP